MNDIIFDMRLANVHERARRVRAERFGGLIDSPGSAEDRQWPGQFGLG
jgi:hypothetical protein